ncbi:hypothetical protein F3Y22_tig00110895pilonHSYRG00302 [Hibiscus syriacus]|uniref:Transmembrane protein n=1 Tax=Hibiscus syriacus TaxID=106335 RepID=A0A6A2ZEE2_HIBSY|nr:hypothetical protein F3Y22_tig00110895pilonHSYRG00302 [Hibiscus syriacus]
MGFSTDDVADIVAGDPWILTRSVDDRIAPSNLDLERVLGSNVKDLIHARRDTRCDRHCDCVICLYCFARKQISKTSFMLVVILGVIAIVIVSSVSTVSLVNKFSNFSRTDLELEFLKHSTSSSRVSSNSHKASNLKCQCHPSSVSPRVSINNGQWSDIECVKCDNL